ncbi:DUF1206 domain-containing protein [Aureibacillus halotolerans]|uniref:Uncharacterized protein DUF1206 n=1 Tax=Aureibacillus halotolerans TaxID=1508390 RepID=A0A4R6U529_9BACI|nr:DUF1206 domain-containing protein [Aureibacillus halotolerans]TDQ40836.1 uncharacterized protein DUF1206 [Aureibacillus halotolerans]
MQASRPVNEARQKANKAKNETKPWIRRFGRFGYMAQGVVYGLIGVLALMAAFGSGGQTTGQSGALQSVANMPFGSVLLWVIGIGLIGYVVWEIVKCFKDPENRGSDAKGIIIRIGYFISGIIYGAIAFNAIKLAIGSGGSDGGGQQTLSAKLLSQPFGQWIIGIVGVVIIGYGLYEFISGYKKTFMSKFKTSEMNQQETKIARKAGKMGLMARGTVLAMVGYFFIQTAITANPDETKGLGGALSELAQQPYGTWLLALVALGLVLYGIYSIIRGRYEHMALGR